MLLFDAFGNSRNSGGREAGIDPQARPNRTISDAAQPIAQRPQIIIVRKEARNQQHRMTIAKRHLQSPEDRIGQQHSHLDGWYDHFGNAATTKRARGSFKALRISGRMRSSASEVA